MKTNFLEVILTENSLSSKERNELATNIMKAAKKQGIEIKSSNILDYIDG